MPLKNYGVLKGRAFDRIKATAQNEHFQILINRNNNPHRIAINTKSSLEPSQVLYHAVDNFTHEILDAISQADLPLGFTTIPSRAGTLALDFVRRNLFDAKLMVPLPSRGPADNDDLNDRLDFFVQQAIQDPSASVYAFGEHWPADGVPQGPDKYFPEITHSTGIHDIHMNQGNPPGRFYGDNGIWQDGGLLFHYASRNRWAAVFTAFQSQSFHTDERGNPKPIDPPIGESSAVSIIAALVNPSGDDTRKEFLILLNKSDQAVDLSGWQIVDKNNKKDTLSNQTIAATSTLRINLSGQGAQLSNKGGNITLLDKNGVKITGVSYTSQDAEASGFLVKF